MDQRARRRTLTGLLRDARERTDPAEYGLTRPCGQGRRASGLGLTQPQVDRLLHRTKGTYQRLESGRYLEPPPTLLREVADLLHLDEHEWALLWRLTHKQDPPAPLTDPAAEQVPGAWLLAMEGSRHMSYVTNYRWDVIAHNDVWPTMFLGEPPQNTLEWMLLAPDARKILYDWEQSWAPLVVPQLWAARARWPRDTYLRDLEQAVRDDPDAGPVYEAHGRVYVHPDGSTRPLHHASWGPGWVMLCAASPKAAPNCQLMTLVFEPGDEQPPQLPSIGTH